MFKSWKSNISSLNNIKANTGCWLYIALTLCHPHRCSSKIEYYHVTTPQKFADILPELLAASLRPGPTPSNFPDRWSHLFPSLYPKLKAVFSRYVHATGLSLLTVHLIKGPMTKKATSESEAETCSRQSEDGSPPLLPPGSVGRPANA